MPVLVHDLTINGSTLSQIHSSAFNYLKHIYRRGEGAYLSTDDLNEIAWNATIKVFEKRSKYVTEGKNVCGLACTMARNELMDCIDSQMKMKLRSLPLDLVADGGGLYNVKDNEVGKTFVNDNVLDSNGFTVTFDELREVLENELETLSDIERTIYELRMDKVPYAEIAKICGITAGNARKKWHDIKVRLLRNTYISSRARDFGLVG